MFYALYFIILTYSEEIFAFVGVSKKSWSLQILFNILDLYFIIDYPNCSFGILFISVSDLESQVKI